MKGMTLTATLIVCLAVLSMACLAQDAPRPANVTKQGQEAKEPKGWALPYASQAMTDNLTPKKATVTGSAARRNGVKFDHISDDTPPNQGIAPQKSQK